MIRLIFAATAMVVITSRCLAPALAAEPLKVVASFSIIGDLAKQVGGHEAEVTTLVGPNGDSHVYEPRPADAAALSGADVILTNGLGLEGFLPRLIEASGTKAPVVELTKGIEPLQNRENEPEHAHAEGEEHARDHGHDHGASGDHDHDHGAFDPHAWQSVANAIVYVRNIADAFCAADAAACDGFKARADAYAQQLTALDAEIKDSFAAIPPEKRVIITSHDAFNYFARAYDVTFLAPEGVSTASEASAADVAALIRQVREDKASAIFVESISNPRLIEQIASETGLEIGGALYSDALSEPEGPAATYLDMMRHNAQTIRAAISSR
jgi:zinc/manganese transport system substrate-binding protein